MTVDSLADSLKTYALLLLTEYIPAKIMLQSTPYSVNLAEMLYNKAAQMLYNQSSKLSQNIIKTLALLNYEHKSCQTYL